MINVKQLILLYIFCLVMPGSLLAAAEIAQQFGKMPLVQNVVVAPDGKNMVGIFNIDGKPVVMTAPFGERKTTAIVSLKSSSDRIESVDWVSNNRLLVNASRAEYLAGQYYRIHSMYAVNLDGSHLLEIRNNAVYKKAEHSRFARLQSIHLLNDLAEDDEHVLVTAYDERDRGYAVFKVNVNNSKFIKIEGAANNRGGFVSNRQGHVLFSTLLDEDLHLLTIELKKAPGQPWQKLKTIDLSGDLDFIPIGLSDDGKSVLINTDYKSNFNYLAYFDLNSAEIGPPIYQVEGHDIDSVITKAGRLVGYGFTKDYYEQLFIDPKQLQRNQQIKALMPDRHSYITSYSDDGDRVVIYSVKDNQPGRFLTLDFKTKQADLWFSQYPHLERMAMSQVNPIQFQSRDGLKIHGYLTIPVQKAGPVPVILFPHGGPVSRDDKDFDPFVQFFSAMGYAVLQVNFRGSSGYGNDFETAGYQQWGLKMQDDLMDAMDAVSSNPDLDIKRSCIVGASYGGYAAMVASFRDNSRFQCFVAISGISDLPAMLRTDAAGNDTTKAIQKTYIGDYEHNRKPLDDASAINHVAAINKPMLLVHGVKDTQVSYKQSVELFKALKRQGVAVSYLEQAEGTHYFDTEFERIEAFAALETFLNKHLPR